MHMAYVVGAGIALVSFVAGAAVRSWLAFALPLGLAVVWAFFIADPHTETDLGTAVGVTLLFTTPIAAPSTLCGIWARRWIDARRRSKASRVDVERR
jgi:hypothetical protein